MEIQHFAEFFVSFWIHDCFVGVDEDDEDAGGDEDHPEFEFPEFFEGDGGEAVDARGGRGFK